MEHLTLEVYGMWEGGWDNALDQQEGDEDILKMHLEK